MALNFRRRYKWLFTRVFPSNEEELLMPVPRFDHFVPSVTKLQSVRLFTFVLLSEDRYLPADAVLCEELSRMCQGESTNCS